MTSRARITRIFIKFGYSMTFATYSCFMLLPLVNFNYRSINNLTDIYEGYVLPLQTYYPFNWGWSPMYEFIYATQIFSGSFISISLCTPDLLFGDLIFHACAFCEIIEGCAKALLDNEDIGKLSYPQFKTELGIIVEKHLRLIR